MFTQYILRGVKAGIVAGLAFGAYVALVGNPMVGYAEMYEVNGHGGGPVVDSVVTGIVSVVGGVLFGLLLGAVVLGAVFYFLEPGIPGEGGTKSFLLAMAGFVTVSGAPWLVLPPQPPGVTQALSTDVRIVWYLIMMVAGAVACGLSGAMYNRLRSQYSRPLTLAGSLLPFLLVAALVVISPESQASGPIPGAVTDVFRTITIVGQFGLWVVLAIVHAWLRARDGDGSLLADQGDGSKSVHRNCQPNKTQWG